MTEGLESPRTDPKKRSSRLSRWVAIFAAALGAAAVIVIVYAYWTRPGWAGVADKTFWDYLELLIVPAALAIGVWWLSREQSKRDREAEDAQQRRDLKAENDRRERERNAQFQVSGIRLQEPDACPVHAPITWVWRNLVLFQDENRVAPLQPETFFGTDSQRASIRSSILPGRSKRF